MLKVDSKNIQVKRVTVKGGEANVSVLFLCRPVFLAYVGYSLILSLLLFPLSGCSLKKPVLFKMAPLPDDGRICRVAVLPFSNQTKYAGGSSLVTGVFTSELVKSDIGLVGLEGDVRKILLQHRILPGRTPTIDQLKSMADRLGVQLLILGEIFEMRDKLNYGSVLNPVISIVVRIVDADSGRSLWTTFHKREGVDYQKVMHWGMESTITGLAVRASNEIISAWQDGGLHKCEK